MSRLRAIRLWGRLAIAVGLAILYTAASGQGVLAGVVIGRGVIAAFGIWHFWRARRVGDVDVWETRGTRVFELDLPAESAAALCERVLRERFGVTDVSREGLFITGNTRRGLWWGSLAFRLRVEASPAGDSSLSLDVTPPLGPFDGGRGDEIARTVESEIERLAHATRSEVQLKA
jgi:hypothetical protein